MEKARKGKNDFACRGIRCEAYQTSLKPCKQVKSGTNNSYYKQKVPSQSRIVYAAKITL